MTDTEIFLWSHLRRKQILGVSFYRQKPISNFIVDFFAPVVSLAIEIDGSHHFEANHSHQDRQRDTMLEKEGIKVLRFHNGQVLNEIETVLEVIWEEVEKRLSRRK